MTLRFRPFWLRVVVHLLALTPLALVAWDLALDQLGANPIREVQLRTGRYALLLLILSLACTPISVLPGFKPALTLRRTLGLYAFSYASLHFLNFLAIDYGFDLALIREDLFEKRYAVVGFVAYLCLVPLAVTSTRGWMVKLGRNWERLHRLAYLAAPLACFHFFWQTKADFSRPVLFSLAVILLLVARLVPIGRAALARKQRRLRSLP